MTFTNHLEYLVIHVCSTKLHYKNFEYILDCRFDFLILILNYLATLWSHQNFAHIRKILEEKII